MTTQPDLYKTPRHLPAGDQGLVVEFGCQIDEGLHRKVRALCFAIEKQVAIGEIQGIREIVPTYRSLIILYDSLRVSYGELAEKLIPLEGQLEKMVLPEPQVIEVPTVYGGEFGPDLARIAAHTGLTEGEIIQKHTQQPYLIYMLGFISGFPYLGGMDSALDTPRLEIPRKRIEAGSVGIAGKQTGIYPESSPGGWNLIGRTALKLFDPSSPSPALLKSGDLLKFVAVETLSDSSDEVQNKVVSRVKGEEQYKGDEQNKDEGNQSEIGLQKDTPVEAWKQEATLEILSPGLQTTVQDLGRWGYQAIGVSSSGAMDGEALRIGNSLLGNSPEAAGLEILILGPQIKFLKESYFAITGAFMNPCLNGEAVDMYTTQKAKVGDELSFGVLEKGCRAYLTIEGGIDVPLVLGSRSTAVNSKMGGYAGRALKIGDRLSVGQSMLSTPQMLPEAYRPIYGNEIRLRVILGPQEDYFTEDGIQTFLRSSYTVSQSADRMGYRLEGEQIAHKDSADIISDGICYGAIQVPGQGQPIIMLADRQTVGGYTKIAHVITADLDKIGQTQPGDRIYFEAVTLEEAHRALLEKMENEKNQVSAFLEICKAVTRFFKITVNGNVYDVQVDL